MILIRRSWRLKTGEQSSRSTTSTGHPKRASRACAISMRRNTRRRAADASAWPSAPPPAAPRAEPSPPKPLANRMPTSTSLSGRRRPRAAEPNKYATSTSSWSSKNRFSSATTSSSRMRPRPPVELCPGSSVQPAATASVQAAGVLEIHYDRHGEAFAAHRVVTGLVFSGDCDRQGRRGRQHPVRGGVAGEIHLHGGNAGGDARVAVIQQQLDAPVFVDLHQPARLLPDGPQRDARALGLLPRVGLRVDDPNRVLLALPLDESLVAFVPERGQAVAEAGAGSGNHLRKNPFLPVGEHDAHRAVEKIGGEAQMFPGERDAGRRAVRLAVRLAGGRTGRRAKGPGPGSVHPAQRQDRQQNHRRETGQPSVLYGHTLRPSPHAARRRLGRRPRCAAARRRRRARSCATCRKLSLSAAEAPAWPAFTPNGAGAPAPRAEATA